MPSIVDLIRDPKGRKRVRPEQGALWVFPQWVAPGMDWAEGMRRLMRALPREVREKRPANWFALISETHGFGRVPPGNAGFYLPSFCMEVKSVADVAKQVGLKVVQAHARILPVDSEIGARAEAIADGRAWNLDPVLGHLYLYPELDKRAGKWSPRATTFTARSLSRRVK